MNHDLLLAELVSEKFHLLTEDKFIAKVLDEVDELENLLVQERLVVRLPKVGKTEVFAFTNGLVATCTAKGLWSLYESQARVDERHHIRNWANFSRSRWQEKVPTSEGLYFAKDRDLGKRTIRELRRVQGRLLDVSGGLVPPGKVTTFAGLWWAHAIPNLPGSY